MFLDIFSSKVLFRIINFAAFIGFFGYLFKRSLLPSIRKQIQEKKLLIQNLEQQKQGIKYQHSNLDNAIEQQEHLAADLSQKIDLWNIKVAEWTQQMQEEEKKIRKSMQERELIQSHEQTRTKLNKEVLPQVIKNVEKDLTEYFDQPENNKAFIDNIVALIQERGL